MASSRFQTLLAVEVAVSLPLSGEEAPYGRPVLEGVQLAIDEANAIGGALVGGGLIAGDSLAALGIGIVLMIYPYFVSSVLALVGIGVLLLAGLFVGARLEDGL